MNERDPRFTPYPGDKITDANGWSFRIGGIAHCFCHGHTVMLMHTNKARDGDQIMLPLADYRIAFEDATVDEAVEV